MGHLAHTPENFQRILKAIPHKERLATLHAICLQISLQSLFRIFPHASCVHIFRDISGKYSKIHKGFSPFFPSSLKKSDDAICIRQIRNRLSYFTKMLVNTSSIHSAFCFIWRKIWRRICRTIFVRYCPFQQGRRTISCPVFVLFLPVKISWKCWTNTGECAIILRKHWIKLVRKMRCQIFRQIA